VDRTAITANAPKTTLDPRENRPARDGNGLRPDRLGDAGGQGQVETGDGSGVPVGLDGDEPGVLFADAVVGGEHLLVGGGEGPAEAVAQGEGLGGGHGPGVVGPGADHRHAGCHRDDPEDAAVRQGRAVGEVVAGVSSGLVMRPAIIRFHAVRLRPSEAFAAGLDIIGSDRDGSVVGRRGRRAFDDGALVEYRLPGRVPATVESGPPGDATWRT